ncbi:hypothetical protein [Methanolobus sp.]|uniref:hypothetical protein n=1 Tax=Methanolobus sp. TaxID=1874737 RepID=UPI0025CE56C0|nr:hypothetical protein [Methanolobus sp.]
MSDDRAFVLSSFCFSVYVSASASMLEETAELIEEEGSTGIPSFTALAGIVFASLAFIVSRKEKSE